MLFRGFAVGGGIGQQLRRREFVGQLFVTRFNLCEFVEHDFVALSSQRSAFSKMILEIRARLAES